jgi:hypothetical protein
VGAVRREKRHHMVYILEGTAGQGREQKGEKMSDIPCYYKFFVSAQMENVSIQI